MAFDPPEAAVSPLYRLRTNDCLLPDLRGLRDLFCVVTLTLFAVAFIGSLWAFVLFHRESTEIYPTSPTNRKLITSGPYQFTRNPMYLGLVILTLGVALWVGAWPMFIAPVAIFATANWVHVPFEEAKMRRQFGATYEDYVERVRRWV